MSRKWPAMFLNDAKLRPGKVLGQEPEETARGCQNCGAKGFMAAFYVTRGPFVKLPVCNKDECLHCVEDAVYGYVWYLGNFHVQQCPVCHGSTGKIETRPMELEHGQPA